MTSGGVVQPNFYLWGAWKSRTIKEPFLTKKVPGQLKKIVLGETFIVGLKERGQVVSWGKDTKHGCLGLGTDTRNDRITEAAAPEEIRDLHHVTDIQMGQDHVIALTSFGEVYCWGRGDKGQLGNGETKGAWKPSRVDDLQNDQIIQIAAVRNS